ncbi:maternal embryonic leucine zipper kinase [Platysternon megacephalum]|uniref:Maternal embryonic leucine zipper kinase n=1 Tax=Platysternon megacephalum TaxID=55544 RepID=A0A4D9EBX0_9SAUR|nr:maternal embryonic leucine zipper kinase [Platysternon megacephalum]
MSDNICQNRDIIRLCISLSVKGWGKDAPFTSYQVQNKSKNPKTKETVTHLPHIYIAPSTKKELAQATKSTKDRSKPNCKLTTRAVRETVSGKEKVPVCCRQSPNCAPMTDSTKGERSNGKLHATQAFQGEKSTKTLPGNKYNKRQLEKLTNKALKCKDMSLPHISHGNLHENLRCMTLKTLVVLLQLKETAPCLHLEPFFKKRKAISVQGNEKSLNTAATETAY